MQVSSYISKLPFLGGDLSLDFVNTVHNRHEEPLRDLLHNYLDLVTWIYFSDAINDSQKNNLIKMGLENQGSADQIFKDAHQLREAFYDFSLNLINQDKASSASIPLINQWISKAFSNLVLVQLNGQFILAKWSIYIGLECRKLRTGKCLVADHQGICLFGHI